MDKLFVQKGKKRKGGNKHCVFGICSSDSRKNDSNEYSFLLFPKPCINVKSFRTVASAQHIKMCNICEKCNNWIKSCMRVDGKFEKIEHAISDKYICSKHFVKEDLRDKYPNPLREEDVLFLNNGGTDEQGADEIDGTAPTTSDCKLGAGKNRKRMLVLPLLDKTPSKKHKREELDVLKDLNSSNENVRTTPSSTSLPGEELNRRCSRTTQTTFTVSDVVKLKSKINELESENAMLKEKLKKYEKNKGSVPFSDFVEVLKEDDAMCRFYTGLGFVQIMALFNFLAITAENINYWGKSNKPEKRMYRRKLQPLEELVMTLVRLRSGLLLRDLKYRFSISQAVLSRTFTTMIQYMFNKFNIVRPYMFPRKEIIQMHLPELFSKLKNIRTIIDCAEFYCQNSSNLYSEYKAHTTFKVLIGCTPNGVISFISDLFEGCISDRQIVKDSKLMDLLEEGDLVLADRGFTIDDLTNEKRVALNIPPFLKGRAHLTAEEEKATKDIASKRIYIEHVVGRIKQFRLLNKVLPPQMRGILSQTVFVAGCLVNFQPPILHK